MLQVLTTRIDPRQITIISEIYGAIVDPEPSRSVPFTWPEFGLPLNYLLPYENTLGIGHSTQHVVSLPLIDEAQPIMHTITQPWFEYPHLVYHVAEWS